MSDNMNNIEEVVESEEALAVALSEEALETAGDVTEGKMIGYVDKDGGLSGLTDQQRRRKEIWDKVTTGILIFLMASPILIVTYILLWFFLR